MRGMEQISPCQMGRLFRARASPELLLPSHSTLTGRWQGHRPAHGRSAHVKPDTPDSSCSRSLAQVWNQLVVWVSGQKPLRIQGRWWDCPSACCPRVSRCVVCSFSPAPTTLVLTRLGAFAFLGTDRVSSSWLWPFMFSSHSATHSHLPSAHEVQRDSCLLLCY